MTEESYDLKKSSEGQLRQLYPILLDVHGNVIDGFHRKEVDENWPTITLGHIDSTAKLELARLASNFCRRNVSAEELEQKIGFLIGAGLKVEEIAEQTGISERTIFKYMPERLKDKEKVKAGLTRKSYDSAEAVQQTVKTQDMPPHPPTAKHPVKCDLCPIGTGTWFPYRLKDGRVLCPVCLKSLWDNGEVTEDDLLKEGETPQVKSPEKPKPKLEVREYKPQEKWEQRVAQMHPQHSKMEQELLLKLQGLGVMRDKEFCVQTTTPDFYFPKQKLAVYVDGLVHKGKEERDSYLRNLLTERHQVRVVAIPYEAFSKQEVERVFDQIKEALI